MLKSELLTQGIKLARLNPNDSHIVDLAEQAFERAVKEYSSQGIINVGQKATAVSLVAGQNILGLPALKRGCRLHWCRDTNDLPSLSGYNPTTNNFGYIMNRDFFVVGTEKQLYGIVASTGTTTTYAWTKSSDFDSYIHDAVDTVVPKLESIIAIVGSSKWLNMTLTDYWANGKEANTYCALPMGNEQWVIHSPEAADVELIYNEAVDNSSLTNLAVTPMLQNLLANRIAYEVCRTSELKNTLATEVTNAVSKLMDRNVAFVLPTLDI